MAKRADAGASSRDGNGYSEEIPPENDSKTTRRVNKEHASGLTIIGLATVLKPISHRVKAYEPILII